MEKSIKIVYRIQTLDADAVHDDHEEQLEALALERIFEMIEEGYREGQLFHQLRLETEGEEGTVSRTYSGHWECHF